MIRPPTWTELLDGLIAATVYLETAVFYLTAILGRNFQTFDDALAAAKDLIQRAEMAR